MSKTYPDLPLESFPDAIDNLWMVKDIDSPEIKAKIDTYLNLAKNDMQSAKDYLLQNQELKDYMTNADFINRIVQSVIAMQRFYMSDFKEYIATAIKYVGEWQPNTQYDVLEVVEFESLLYMSISNEININSLPIDENFYIKITIKGDKGDPGLNLSPRGYWDAQLPYYQYNLVVHNNILYYASVDNVGQEPYEGSQYWVGVLMLVDGTTTQKGIVKLSNDVSSSQQEAITPLGVQKIIGTHNHNGTSPTFIDVSARNGTFSGVLNVAQGINSSSTISATSIVTTENVSLGKNLTVGGTINSEGAIETKGSITAGSAAFKGNVSVTGTLTAGKVIGAVYG